MFKLEKKDEKEVRKILIKTLKSKPFPMGYYLPIGEEMAIGTYIDENGMVQNFGEQMAWDADVTEIEKLPTEALVYLVFNGVHKGDRGWDNFIEWKRIYNEITEANKEMEKISNEAYKTLEEMKQEKGA